MEHYRKAERMYLKANINKNIFDTTAIEITEGKSVISIDISDKFFHALGAIHGAIYFKLLDDACFFAVSSIVTDVFVLTTSFNIHIIKPVSSGKITAIGKIKFQSKNFFIAEASLFNDKGQEIAFGTGDFTKSKIELTEKIGYL
jgi:uncharacterized protein (TIGR00369 family)